jgi:hypothetical protein
MKFVTNINLKVGIEILTALAAKSVFWDMTPCTPVKVSRNTWRYIPKDRTLHQLKTFMQMQCNTVPPDLRKLSADGVRTNSFAARTGLKYLNCHCCNTSTNRNCCYRSY